MTEREKFEKWAKDGFMLAYSSARYRLQFTQRAWEAWQAARATPEPIGDPTEEMVLAGIAAANRQMPYINDAQKVLAIWNSMQARATPALPQGEPVVELAWHERWRDTVRELRFIDSRTSFDIPVGTKFYLHPPKPQALPQAEHDLEDVRCQCCGYMTYHSEHMGCIRSAYKQALPQVPEGMAIVPVDAIPAALPMEPFQTIDMGSKNYKAGWNACRLAMLAAAKEQS